MILSSHEQFTEVLEIAARVLRVREDLETFEGERLGLHAALTQDWEGGARDDFEEGWALTATTKSSATEQLAGFERDLAQMWATSVERHNENSYNRAIDIAGGVLQGEREEHNAARELLEDADAALFGWFTDQPQDRVPRVSYDAPVPTEGDRYSPSNSFVHYERQGDSWVPYWRSYPDPDVWIG